MNQLSERETYESHRMTATGLTPTDLLHKAVVKLGDRLITGFQSMRGDIMGAIDSSGGDGGTTNIQMRMMWNTMHNMSNTISTFTRRFVRSTEDSAVPMQVDEVDDEVEETTTPITSITSRQLRLSDGRISAFSQGYEIPRQIDLRQAWNVWNYGSNEHPALKNVKAAHLPRRLVNNCWRSQSTTYSQMKSVFMFVNHLMMADRQRIESDQERDLSADDHDLSTDVLFARACDKIYALKKLSTKSAITIRSLKWNSFYKCCRKYFGSICGRNASSPCHLCPYDHDVNAYKRRNQN